MLLLLLIKILSQNDFLTIFAGVIVGYLFRYKIGIFRIEIYSKNQMDHLIKYYKDQNYEEIESSHVTYLQN